MNSQLGIFILIFHLLFSVQAVSILNNPIDLRSCWILNLKKPEIVENCWRKTAGEMYVMKLEQTKATGQNVP